MGTAAIVLNFPTAHVNFSAPGPAPTPGGNTTLWEMSVVSVLRRTVLVDENMRARNAQKVDLACLAARADGPTRGGCACGQAHKPKRRCLKNWI